MVGPIVTYLILHKRKCAKGQHFAKLEFRMNGDILTKEIGNKLQ